MQSYNLFLIIILYLYLILMRQSTIKANNYAKQIRKNQRNQIIMELRSKLLKSENLNECQHIQEEKKIISQSTILSFFNERLPNTSDLHKIIQILLSITNQYTKQQTEGKTFYNVDILQYILSLSNSSSFQFQFINLENGVQNCQLSVLQFKEVLIQMPKLIKQLLQQININLARLKNFILKPEKIRQYYAILQKIEQCRDIKTMNICFGSFLAAYSRILNRKRFIQNSEQNFINYELIQLMTDCLIETTCFKPRFLKESSTSQQILLIFKAINEQMSQIRNSINGQICNKILSFIQSFNQRQQPLKIFNNYIYIIGNAFISLNSHKNTNQQQKYCQIHHIVLNKFGQIIKQIVTHMQDVNGEHQTNIIQISSLIVWFIRNQILINQGMFDLDKNNGSNKEMANLANEYWLQIIFGILNILKTVFIKKYSSTINTINEVQTSLVVEALSLLQLLYFDFSLAKPNLQEIINWLNIFRNLLRLKARHHDLLHKKIYEFYLILACSQQNDQEMMKGIVYQANIALNQWPSDPNGIQFCCKLLQPQNKLPIQYKMALFQNICNSLDIYLQRSLNSDKIEASVILLSLIYSASRIQLDIRQKSFIIFEFLNESRVRMILQLCSKVWQQQLKIENLIETLQLLKLLSDKQQYTILIKQITLKAGYYQQLQILSQNVNEEINRLVYQIYEILQIN